MSQRSCDNCSVDKEHPLHTKGPCPGCHFNCEQAETYTRPHQAKRGELELAVSLITTYWPERTVEAHLDLAGSDEMDEADALWLSRKLVEFARKLNQVLADRAKKGFAVLPG